MRIGLTSSTRAVCASIAITLLGLASTVQAQNEQRREFVQGLLKSLIESQLEQHNHRNEHRPRPPQAPQNPDLAQFRAASKEMRDHTERLVTAVQREVPNSPGMRNHLHAVMDAHAAADVLYRDSARVKRAADLQTSLAAFDRKWRLLSYRLHEESRIPQNCVQLVDAIDGHCTALCKRVGLQPQLDLSALGRSNDTLTTELRHLVETIDLELGRTQKCRDLTIQGQRCVQLSRLVSIAIVTRRDHASIVRAFKQWHASWQEFAAALWGLENRHIERDIQHVDEEIREMHALLWLPLPVDYRQLLHLTTVLMKDIDLLFDSVSLNTLLTLRTSQNVLTTSSEFYGLCEHFTHVIEDKEPMDHMVRDFQDLERSWPQLANCFSSSRDPKVVQSIRSIDQTFVSLRDALRIRPDNNLDLALQVTTALDVLGEQLNNELNGRIFRRHRYPADYVKGFNTELATFHAQMEGIEKALTMGTPLSSLRNPCREALRTWTRIRADYVQRMPQEHRVMIIPFTSEMTSHLVQLETLAE